MELYSCGMELNFFQKLELIPSEWELFFHYTIYHNL
jgi:hypothetical protein